MTVYLVGAGPGDPDLLTMRAARLLGRADVVIHDRLVGSGVLDLIPSGTPLVDVGKRPGDPRRAQADLNALLLHYAALYEVVVRLKGGDPYVFGRGGEEAFALLDAGHRVEVVPGLSSAIAAPAAAGIPLTHRGRSHGFTVVTAASAHDVAGVDWLALAQLDHTLVVLMGVRLAPHIATVLIAGGRSPDEPVAVIGSATTACQQVERTTLARLAQVRVPAPATIVIGDVAGFEGLPVWQGDHLTTHRGTAHHGTAHHGTAHHGTAHHGALGGTT